MSDLVMKEAELFLVSGESGDLSGDTTAHGLYTRDTRYLSRLELRVGGEAPHLLSAYAAQNYRMRFYYQSQRTEMADYDHGRTGSVGIERHRVIEGGVLYERISVHNYGLQPVQVVLELRFGADFRDLFEVRGAVRPARGTLLPPEVGRDRVLLAYRGLDEQVRRTAVEAQPVPEELDGLRARWVLSLQPGAAEEVTLAVAPELPGGFPEVDGFGPALARVRNAYARWNAQTTAIETDDPLVNRTLERSRLDLRTLLMDLGHGPFPVAGVPWFAVPFGRDSLITALQVLPISPAVAMGTLRTLAALQGQEVNLARQEQPGKILHELRQGEMALLGEVPFLRYYGSVDATPLFLVLLGEIYRWTGDLSLAAELLPQIQAALQWIRTYGDQDGDGFVEYESDAQGLVVQSWKDSADSMSDTAGRAAASPVAVCEVQGYVYDAYRKLVPILRDLARAGLGGDGEALLAQAAELEARAAALAERFDRAFWMPDQAYYAIALDGEKRQVGTIASDPGHCLWAGLVPPARRQAVADALMNPALFSGWGVRTLAEGERTYNPMSYHNGSVWPHDNSLIALGLKRAGFDKHAARLAGALFSAANHFPLHRLPELFCGYPEGEGEPVRYPVACSPQAWAAATPFMLIQAVLGLEPDAPRGVLRLRPRLPEGMSRVRVRGLRVGEAVVDLDVTREGVCSKVRQGRLEVIL